MTQPQGAVATPVPPLIALPCLMLDFGPVPQRSLLNLAGGESVPTGVSWDPSLPLRDLGTVAVLRVAHLCHAASWDTAITVIHCLLVLLTVLNHLAGSRGLPPQAPRCLCEGVLELLLRAAAAEAAAWSWVGGGH